ncbi:AAA family ATPase [Catenulispora yoronensis]|uniref:AAA family ATPase n=1 Tax=Catenulispora yoronensis TaxID=450799 RepID=UPI0031DAFD4C
MVRGWPFTGRTAEVADALAGLTRTDMRGVFIGGPAGIGKTCLLKAALARLAADQTRIVRVYATAATSASSFGAVRPLTGQRPLTGLDPAEIIELLLARLRDGDLGSATVLAIDDVHLLDRFSASFAYRAVVEGAAILAATYRTGEELPDLVGKLRHDDAVAVIRLGALAPTATAAVLTEVLGGPVQSRSASDLHRLAQGNPLLLREIVDSADGRAGFELRFGLWCWSPTAAVLEAGPARQIEARLAGLPARVREVAALVALSEPLELPILLQIVGSDTVELATRDRVIRTVALNNRTDVYLEHPLYGEVIRLRLDGDGVQTNRLYGTLANAVEDLRFGVSSDALRTATWRLRSGTPPDPDLMVAGARAAYGRYEVPLAIELAKAAIAGGAGFDAVEVLAASHAVSEDPIRALEVLAEARPGLTNNDERIRAAQTEAVVRFTRLYQSSADDALRQEGLSVPRSESRVALPMAAAMLFWTGRVKRAVADTSLLAESDALSPAARSIATAMALAMKAYMGAGEDCLEHVASLPTPTDADWQELPYAQAAGAFGRWVPTLVTATVVRKLPDAPSANALYFPLHDGIVTLSRAMAHRMAGRVQDARRTCVEMRLNGDTGSIYASACMAEQAQSTALLGLAEEAAEALADADRRHQPTMNAMYPWIELARSQVAASRDGAQAAFPIIDTLLARLRSDGFTGLEIHALLASARFGLAEDGDIERLAELREKIPGSFPVAVHEHALGLSTSDTTHLLRAASIYQALGLDLHAAEATSQALAISRMRRSAGTGDLANRVASMLEHCDTVRTPALTFTIPRLTPFQTDVATLAAAGQKTPVIAGSLGYTNRHIENTLYDIYRALGVSRRSDLAGVLHLFDLVASLESYP